MDLPCDDESAGLSEYTDTVVEVIGDRTELVLVASGPGPFTHSDSSAGLPTRARGS